MKSESHRRPRSWVRFSVVLCQLLFGRSKMSSTNIPETDSLIENRDRESCGVADGDANPSDRRHEVLANVFDQLSASTDGMRESARMAGVERSGVDWILIKLMEPVDAASSIVFRIGFGLIAAWWCFDDLRTGRIRELYVVPRLHFTYYLFDFIRPWPGDAMIWHFVGLLILSLFVAAGLFYRITTTLFAIGFTYFFLLDQTNYQNHYYLLTLLSWVMVLLPLNRCASLDARFGLVSRSDTVPKWSVWFLRFHIALPYFFGGIAKLHADWFAGEPMRTHLTSMDWFAGLKPLLTSEVSLEIFTWGGLLFDLAIVPLLLWRRTRIVAYALCVGFHLTNACLFNIHIFPWFMIVATTIFLDPSWLRSILRSCRPALLGSAAASQKAIPRSQRLAGGLVLSYCLAQLLIPLRAFCYEGNSAWTERGHHFAWRMMMRTKASALRYYVTDPKTGKTGSVDLRRFVTPGQLASFSRDPEMILHLAQIIRNEFYQVTSRDVEVRALVLTTLNGRKPELLIDPTVDLAKEPRGYYFRSWILPQREPLREVAWSVPMLEWERHVDIPPLNFLERGKSKVPARNLSSRESTGPQIRPLIEAEH